jgi:hypothetical protein
MPYIPLAVEIEFDSAKDARNLRERGLSFALALILFENLLGEVEDTRRDYGERRMIAFGLIAGRLHACVYTVRGSTRRIISLRKASRKEQLLWRP